MRKIIAVLLLFLLVAPMLMGALSVGSRGETVRQVQKKLLNWGYYQGAADGIYGQETYKAVKFFQQKNGLKADGIVGDATLKALGIASGSTTATTANDRNVELLAHLVYGEARGEPYLGQVAVAAVVLNRVESASFPNTISGVIYQSGAFDAVSDGQIDLSPNAQCDRAARDALNGWDPTNGCLYYYNPSTATSRWIWSRTVMLTIGKHNFAL